MTSVSFDIKGLDKLIKDLKQLEPKVQKKVVRKTLREGSKVIHREIKSNTVPVDSGDLRKSIKVRAGKRKRNTISVTIQTSDKENVFTGDQYYGAFQEFGTSKMPGKHYMEKAFNSKEEEAKAKMMDILAKGIIDEAK